MSNTVLGGFFPTCQVRVVRFYVSLFSSSSSSSSFSSFSSASSSVSLSCRDSVCSVWHVGPQPRYCEFSVACWTPTAILCVQCGVLDPNCNWDPLSSVWRAGPQPRSYEFSVACRTSTVMATIGSSCRKSVSKKYKEVVARCHKISQLEGQKECVRETGQKYVRNVRRYCYV